MNTHDYKQEKIERDRKEAIKIQERMADDYHTRCHDCGVFLAKKLWVPKNHRSYTHAICRPCASGYESPYDY